MKKGRKKPGRPASSKSKTVAEIPLACSDELAAVEFMERQRWEDCPCCVHCGSVGVYKMRDAQTGKRNKRFLWRCHDCKRQFTVRSGTVYEESRIPLRYWCYAFWAMCASKKGVSAKQIQRQTGLSYKSALFLLHRIRCAMAPDRGADKLSGIVEIDETYVGGKPRYKGVSKRGRGTKKTPVLAMVERGGDVRAEVVQKVNAQVLRTALEQNVAEGSRIMTDDLAAYKPAVRGFGRHKVVRHSDGEYVNKRFPHIHTNTIEGFFSLLKRGMYGTYHAVSKRHLHRYLAEFEFRYNTRTLDDGERTSEAIRQATGRRLPYRQPVRN